MPTPDPKAPARDERAVFDESPHPKGSLKQHVVCMGDECRQAAGQFNSIHRFDYDDDLISFARSHAERTGHEVLVPFRIYERKGK